MITQSAAVYRNDAQPDWGLGLVVEEELDRFVLIFEHGGRKVFVKSKAKGLSPVSLDPAALRALQAKVGGGARPAARAGGSKKKKTPARFATFEEQVKHFEKLFPSGFEDETFIERERGPGGAIAQAQEELSKERFEEATPEELFAAARRVLASTRIVYPIEGHIPFGQLHEADRPAALAGLKQLLHGEGDYGERVAQFAASVNLVDKKGKKKRVTWPLATVFGALFSPLEHTCVKPAPFASQATTLGMAVEATAPVSAEGYRQFLEVVKATQQRLVAAGHQPRDLVDVYAFIWRTHAEKPA